MRVEIMILTEAKSIPNTFLIILYYELCLPWDVVIDYFFLLQVESYKGSVKEKVNEVYPFIMLQFNKDTGSYMRPDNIDIIAP